MNLKINKLQINPLIILFHVFVMIQMVGVIFITHKRGISTNGILNISITYFLAPFIILLIMMRLYKNFKNKYIILKILNGNLEIVQGSKKEILSILKIKSVFLSIPYDDMFKPAIKNPELLVFFNLLRDAQKTSFGIKRGISMKIIFDETKISIKNIQPTDSEKILELCKKLLETNPKILIKDNKEIYKI
jgi:hypothetical protein